MEKKIRLLGVLLVAQLALAAGLLYAGRSGGGPDADEARPLLEFDVANVDRIEIEGPEEEVTLSRVDGTWQVPAPGGEFPADASRVESLLAGLSKLDRGPVVATTAGARERFEVAEDSFQRRIVLASGDEELARLYVGTSPVMRKVHARAGEDDEVHLVDFAAYEAPARAQDWQDRDVLKLEPDRIAAIEVGGLKLTRLTLPPPAATEAGEGGTPPDAAPESALLTGWRATGLAEGEKLDQNAVDRLASLVSDIRIGEVLDVAEQPGYGLAEPALVLRVELVGGESREYRFGKEREKEAYVLKSSSRPEYFGLAYFTANPIVEAAERKALVE
jgi:hypothetical protein